MCEEIMEESLVVLISGVIVGDVGELDEVGDGESFVVVTSL